MQFRSPAILTLLITVLLFSCKDDKDAAPDLAMRPSFSAFIIADLPTSIAWYNSVLGTSVKQRIYDSAGDIVILASASIELELLQLHAVVTRNDALSNHPQGTQIQGLLKIGFAVDNMDSWLTHLDSLDVDTQVFTDTATGKTNVLISDPDGNLIQFFEK